MARRTFIRGCLGVTLVCGCILEDNPDFIEDTAGTTSGATMDSGTLSGPGPTTGDPDPDTTADPDPEPQGTGCDDPAVCTTYHIGPVEGSCPHKVDEVTTNECDWVGSYALRIAAAAIEFEGRGGLIVMHDNNGVNTSYVGGIDVFGQTTIRAAEELSPEAITVYSQDTDGVIRLREDGVHLQGFTLACRSSGEWALTVREDLEIEGTETGNHLIETMIMVGTKPEEVGANSIDAVFQSLGRETTVRNSHMWGYFEGSLDMRFATNSVFSHNTVVYYGTIEGAPGIDATQADGLQITNNVFASLSAPGQAFVAANDSTSDLVVAGNRIEGYISVLGGLEPTDPEVTLDNNAIETLELESPRNPLFLEGAAASASDRDEPKGISLDGIVLADASPRRPGAYQGTSALSVPRRSVVTVGESMCGNSPCDVTKGFDNELQRAFWTAWPGAVVEIYPSATPYAGPVVISWPVVLRGAGDQPDDVVLQQIIEDEPLNELFGLWTKDVVINILQGIGSPVVVELLTIEASSDQIGIFHEGRGTASLRGRHEIRRVILRDDGSATERQASAAVHIGDDVVVHDVLVHGGYRSCVRFGPRSYSGAATPVTTAHVHHLTCRLTVPSPRPEDDMDPQLVAAFEIASVADAVIADAVIELPEPGPLFRAQRRSSGDSEATAVDVPMSFTADAISVAGHGLDFDGFTDVDGSYAVTVDPVGVMEPLFVSTADSRLAPGALGIDGGVDPAMLEPGLALSTALDGVSRSGLVVDRGCYEQGM